MTIKIIRGQYRSSVMGVSLEGQAWIRRNVVGEVFRTDHYLEYRLSNEYVPDLIKQLKDEGIEVLE